MSAKSKRHTIRFEMLLTPEQNEAWESLAERAGVSKAELVRRRMDGCHIRTIPAANWQTYWRLGEIGHNIDQIVEDQRTAIAHGLLLPLIDSIPFEQLQSQINELRLQLLLGMENEPDSDLEEASDWED